MTQDKRSNRIIFIAGCVICQAFQAQGIVKYESTSVMKPVIDTIMSNDINIIQLPCPESSFLDYSNLKREPKGLKHYDTTEFNLHCVNLTRSAISMIKEVFKAGYEIIAILGIENSPTCAIDYIYTNKGMVKRRGIFMGHLENGLLEEGINTSFIGINRRSVKGAVSKIEGLIEKTS